MDDRQVSIFKILKNDYLAVLPFIAVVVSAGMAAASMAGILDPEAVQFFVAMCGLSVGVGLPVAFWRVGKVKRVLDGGQRVLGQVTDANFYKDRGRIEFTYSYAGTDHSGGCAVMRNAETSAMKPGREVVLVVDIDAPDTAYLLDLYVS